MQIDTAVACAIAAAVANGAMVGATLDQSIKQLPPATASGRSPECHGRG